MSGTWSVTVYVSVESGKYEDVIEYLEELNDLSFVTETDLQDYWED